MSKTILSAALLAVALFLSLTNTAPAAQEQPLWVGWAVADVTPAKPVPLVGQMHKRISQSVHDPLVATALALETRGAGDAREQAVMVCCDICVIRKSTQERVRQLLREKLKDFDAEKLFLNATHTHSAPPTDDSFGATCDVSGDAGVMGAAEYADFFTGRVAEAVVQAWQNRKPGGMSWALGQAVVGHNRRVVYADGRAVMYGNPDDPKFLSLEGYEDHGLELLFFWDEQERPTGLVINVVCPSQQTESESFVSADFWHEVRQKLQKRYGKDIRVLAQCGAAGDQSPRPQVRTRAEQIMLERKGISRRQELAQRIVRAVEEVFPIAQGDIKTQLVFKHAVARVDLPLKQPVEMPFYVPDSPRPVELHVLRLGAVAMATNPFEMFLDYGMRMKARSKGVLTFVVNLACQHSGYLPTAKGVQGGGYSADRYLVGPEGGQVLVEETVKRINQMWE